MGKPFEGCQQAVHDAPQLSVLSSSRHTPPQLCVPLGHIPSQGASSSMHEPLHSAVPEGHEGTQLDPLQLTLPPSGA